MNNPRGPGFVVLDGYDLDLALDSVPAGWSDLIENIFAVKPENVKIIQVKEKFGGLRCYFESTEPTLEVDTFRSVVRLNESRSYSTCMICGQEGVYDNKAFTVFCGACDEKE